MDFITNLLISNNCDFIWVIINFFTKVAYFILLEINGKKTDNFIHLFI